MGAGGGGGGRDPSCESVEPRGADQTDAVARTIDAALTWGRRSHQVREEGWKARTATSGVRRNVLKRRLRPPRPRRRRKWAKDKADRMNSSEFQGRQNISREAGQERDPVPDPERGGREDVPEAAGQARPALSLDLRARAGQGRERGGCGRRGRGRREGESEWSAQESSAGRRSKVEIQEGAKLRSGRANAQGRGSGTVDDAVDIGRGRLVPHVLWYSTRTYGTYASADSSRLLQRACPEEALAVRSWYVRRRRGGSSTSTSTSTSTTSPL